MLTPNAVLTTKHPIRNLYNFSPSDSSYPAPPPGNEFMITENKIIMISESGRRMITEDKNNVG